ncbi:hypothetical protein ACTFIR_009090 [Dictyostelium discoideum]
MLESNNIFNDLSTTTDPTKHVLFNPDYFSIFAKEYCLYSLSSSYYLELFINYFIKNLNDNTINYLCNYFCIASEKGYTQIFKKIISSDQNNFIDFSENDKNTLKMKIILKSK